MAKRKVAVWAYTCERCGHQWIQKQLGIPEPKVCPNSRCKSPYWDRPRREPATKKKSKKSNGTK